MSFGEPGQTPRWHWYLLAAVGLSRLVNLGFSDLQAWDEALYTVRAQAITRFGDLFDQSPHAIDGLYSSLHPPLYVWLTAGVFHLFGEGEWTARLISALAGAATLPIIALLGKRLANPQTGLVAALLFGLNPFVTFFARQGQFDTLMVFLLALSVFYFLRTIDSPTGIAPVFAGLSLGLALMTKLFVAIGIPAAVISYVLIRGERPSAPVITRLLSAMAVAAVISIPWHAYMSFSHGEGNPLFFFAQSSLVERAIYGVEANVKPLEILYYFNQLIVLFPAGAFFFFWGVREFHASRQSTGGLLWFWFVLFFVVFSLMRTKLAVYTLPMYVPLSLLAASIAWSHTVRPFERTPWFCFISGTSLFMIWSSSQDWRNALKDVLSSLLSLESPKPESALSTAMLVSVGAVTAALTYWMVSRSWFPASRRYVIVSLLALTGGISVNEIAFNDIRRYKDGGTELAAFIETNGFQRIVVAGYERNPQLTYYLRGADLGWRADLSVRRIIPPSAPSAYGAWLRDELIGEPSHTLLLIEKDKFVRYQIVEPQEFVPSDYELVLDSRRYSAYLRHSSDFLARNDFGTIL